MAGDADKRTRITGAAQKLFIEQGFHNTSTAQISREAGVATGTLFLYFPTKDELINTLYKEAKQELTIALREDFPEAAGTHDKLRHLWLRATDWAWHNSDSFRFMHMFSSSPLITNLTREEVAPSAGFAIKFIEEGIKKGEIMKIDLNLLMALLNGLLTGTLAHLGTVSEKKRKQVASQTFDIFWKGISA